MTFEDSPRWLPPLADPPPPPPPPKPREVPIWAPFAALLAAVLIISMFGAAVVAIVAANDPTVKASDPPVNLVLILTAIQDAAFVFAAWLTVRLALGRTPREQFGLVRVRRIWQAVGWAAAVFVAFWLITAALSAIDKPDDQQLVKDVRDESSFALLAAYFLLICIIAPLVEEFFFRGFLFTVLWRRLGPAWGAVIVGAVFGLGHAPAPWVSLLALGAFGVGLCILYWRTASIVPGMALHALNNSITFGAIKNLDPAQFVGVVVLSVAAVSAIGVALSSRAEVAA